MIHRNRTARRLLATTLSLVAVGISSCAASSPSSSRSSSPPTTQGGSPVCAPQTVAATPGQAALTSALLLSAVVQVSGPRSDHPKCIDLTPRTTVALHVGDSVEFEANNVPQLSPAGTDVVSVSSRPGPTSSGPGDIGGLHTTHVIGRLTAVRAGSVTVRWIDCSGTGC